jgi:hypothetical protein
MDGEGENFYLVAGTRETCRDVEWLDTHGADGRQRPVLTGTPPLPNAVVFGNADEPPAGIVARLGITLGTVTSARKIRCNTMKRNARTHVGCPQKSLR